MELWEQLSDEARQTIVAARNLARSHGCNAVSPEHIALGILEQHGCLALQILDEMGIEPHDLRMELTDAAVLHSDHDPAAAELSFTTTASRCMQMAWVEARKDAAYSDTPAGGPDTGARVSTGHLLLGLLSPASMSDLRVLRKHGVFYGEAGEILRRIASAESV